VELDMPRLETAVLRRSGWLLVVLGASIVLACQAWAEPESADASASARPGHEVVEELLGARSDMEPMQADFRWVMGSAGVEQRTFGGRVYIVGTGRYRVDFEAGAAGGPGGRLFLIVPDGRWAYQFSDNPSMLGIRVDLDLVKQRVRSPAPRIQYDPTGGVLLELLRFQGYVTYEGDEELAEGRCAVLSYQGASMRASLMGGPSGAGRADLRTRLRYRWQDGLLVREEEEDNRGQQQSTYRLTSVKPFEAPAGLLRIPEEVHCIDVSKQLVRRILYGPPKPVPSPIRRPSEQGARTSQR